MNGVIKNLGHQPFLSVWQEMQNFTANRNEDTPDELWIVEHDPVFTLGLAGKEEHILYKNHDIPIIRCDRGGQVTYHGNGQIVIYILHDLKRSRLSVRDLVISLENGIISFLKDYGITAIGDRCAPGVYVNSCKIASIGLKVSKGCTYHGISFNYNMDLKPFSYINPCGYAGLKLTDFITEIKNLSTSNYDQSIYQFNIVAYKLASHILRSINCST